MHLDVLNLLGVCKHLSYVNIYDKTYLHGYWYMRKQSQITTFGDMQLFTLVYQLVKSYNKDQLSHYNQDNST